MILFQRYLDELLLGASSSSTTSVNTSSFTSSVTSSDCDCDASSYTSNDSVPVLVSQNDMHVKVL